MVIKQYLHNLVRLQSAGRPLYEIVDELKVFRFLVIATEWGAMNGGVSTFNANLCKGLVSSGNSVLVAIVRDPAAEDRPSIPVYEGAGDLKFVLIDGPPTSDDLEVASDFGPHFVIGHDRFTGKLATTIAKIVRRPAQSILFVHTDPLIELHKHDASSKRVERREAKERWQKRLIRSADIAVSVGPRLARHTERTIQELAKDERPRHITFLPGLDRRVPTEAPQVRDRSGYRIRTFGRMEDAELKGLDILRDAVALLKGANAFPGGVTLDVLGGGDEEIWQAQNSDEIAEYIDWRRYSGDREDVEGFVRAAHVIVMPSREEGFGLVALEAIAANRPVIASSRSGFSEWLMSLADGDLPTLKPSLDYFIVQFREAEMRGTEGGSAWAAALSTALERIHLEYEQVMQAVEILRAHLESRDWSQRCEELVSELRGSRKLSDILGRTVG